MPSSTPSAPPPSKPNTLPSTGSSTTDRIRAFNRYYTNRVGLLGRTVTADLGLTEARILYEIGADPEPTARQIARRFGFDEGYCSRVLKQLETRGYIQRTPAPQDARVNLLRLTAHGREVQAELIRAAAQAIDGMITDLPAVSVAQLVAAMGAIETILSWPDTPAPALRPFGIGDPGRGDLGWVVQRHGDLYGAREGYDIRFEALVARILSDFVARDAGPREQGWILQAGDMRLGCVFVVTEDDTTARLRLLLLEPFARGRGLGEKLLTTALAHARATGFERMVLWTHAGLPEACGLYQKAGFRLVSSTPGAAFGQKMEDQEWELRLA
ncbi:MAG: GNAT family N-acetyltransferase [Maritimibacter sp.]|nr:GNAT family N-acetyltransferase [Maritimibacter sp.]